MSNKPIDIFNRRAFDLETRIDPKTGLARQYKVFKDFSAEERRVVGRDQFGRDETRRIVRTEGKPWLLLTAASPQEISRTFIESVKDGIVVENLGLEDAHVMEPLAHDAEAIERIFIADVVNSCNIMNELYSSVTLMGTIPVSMTVDQENGEEVNKDIDMDFALSIEIFPLDPTSIAANEDNTLTFSEGTIEIGVSGDVTGMRGRSFIGLREVRGSIDATTHALTLHEWQVDTPDYKENLKTFHEHQGRSKKNARNIFVRKMFPSLSRLLQEVASLDVDDEE